MSTGVRHDHLRRRNRAMVIAALRRSGFASRTEIAAATGLSHSTISAISADLIAEAILRETDVGGSAVARRGRPQVALALNGGAACVLTLVVALNSVAAALVDYAGAVIREDAVRLSTRTVSDAALLGEMQRLAGRMLEHAGGPVLRIVVAVQGTTDWAGRVMLWSPITTGSDLAIADLLEGAFGIPTSLENDCNMIAMALRRHNPGRYRDDFIAILLSHGIGMGLMRRGALFTGTQSSGVEFGHMVHRPEGALCRCGRLGCVEAYAGNYAIWRNARDGGERRPPRDDIGDAELLELAERARAEDGPERRAFAVAGAALGYGLGSLFALLDPAPVALVGVGASVFDLLEPALREALASTAGGQHSGAISFAIEGDEMPLIRDGSALRGLASVDEDVFAPGMRPARGPPPAAGRFASTPG